MSSSKLQKMTKSQSLSARLKSAGVKVPPRNNTRRRRRAKARYRKKFRSPTMADVGNEWVGNGQLVERTGSLRSQNTHSVPSAFGIIRAPSSNPRTFGGTLSQGATYDPEWGYGERIAVQTYITDVATAGTTDPSLSALPWLTTGGAMDTKAFSGFGYLGTNFSGLDLNPSYFGVSRLGTYGTLYNKYRWRGVKVTFFSSTPTNVQGQLSMGISGDPIVFPEGNGAVTPIPSYQAINNHNSTTSGAIWQNFSTGYKYTGSRTWYCRDPQDIPGQPTTGGEDTAADLRSIVQCRLMALLKFLAQGTARAFGYAELAGIIEFFDPVNTTATAAAAPIDLEGKPIDKSTIITSAFNPKRHSLVKHKSGIPVIVRKNRVIHLDSKFQNTPPLYDPKLFHPDKVTPAHFYHKGVDPSFSRTVDDSKSSQPLDGYDEEQPVRVTYKPRSRLETPDSWETESLGTRK